MIGRDSNLCDILLEHPSMSRIHAVIQFKSNNEAFLYDLGSTHGSFINKRPLPSNKFTRIKSGDWLKFGESSRNVILINQDLAAMNSEEEDLYNQANSNKGTDEKNAITEFNKKKSEMSNKEIYNKLLIENNVIKKNLPQYNRMEINWGQVDDHIVYANGMADEHILRTDLLRLLPNLTQNQ
jgi:pSer/pThr/pTyr-binding forkhead associated (FHA) protein